MMGQANRYSNQNLTATLWRKMRRNGDIRSLAQGFHRYKVVESGLNPCLGPQCVLLATCYCHIYLHNYLATICQLSPPIN